MIMWDKVPKGTLIKLNINNSDYVIRFFRKHKDHSIKLSAFFMGDNITFNNPDDCELLLPEDVAKYTV